LRPVLEGYRDVVKRGGISPAFVGGERYCFRWGQKTRIWIADRVVRLKPACKPLERRRLGESGSEVGRYGEAR